MLKIACLCLAVAVTTPLGSQVAPDATGGTLPPDEMMTPPPVSGDAYPVIVGAETRSNFLAGAIVVTGAYNDNLMADPTKKAGDWTYSIVPSISLDRRTPHHSESLSYNSGFTLYQNTPSLNGVTQEGSAGYQQHLSRFTVLSVKDTFRQNYNLFNQANPFVGTGISTGGSSTNAVYVYPFANQFGNSLDTGIEYQYSKSAMIGGGGSFSMLRYSNDKNTPGLDNSDMGQGSAFFSRRISPGQYLGINYEYAKISTHPVQTTTTTQTVFGFYTMYLTHTVSISILGGPQHYYSRDDVSEASSNSWTPAVQGSVGYQMPHTSFSVGFSHIVSSARGLVGAYHSDLAGFTARRQITRTWNLNAGVNYALFKNATPNVSSMYPGGHTISGTASFERSFRERLGLVIGYGRFHQTYNFGTNTSLYPDCNREFASVSYSLSRALGR